MAGIKPVELDFKIIEPSVKKSKNDIRLLHGLTASKAEFEDIENELANRTGRKIYLLDARNHGDSEHSDIFSFDAMTVDVINFMDQHNIRSASFLGHSMGGRLAMVIALTHPERVESIIIEDMSPKAVPRKILDSILGLLKMLPQLINIVPPDADIETATKILYGQFYANIPKELAANRGSMEKASFPLPITKKGGKYTWKTNLSVIAKEFENLKFSENLQGLYQKPALVLYGTVSEFNVGDDEDFILKLFPNAQMCGLPTPHMVHSVCPDEFLQAVEKFLE